MNGAGSTAADPVGAIEANFTICAPLDLVEPLADNIPGLCCACDQPVVFRPPLTNLPKLCLDCAVAMTARRH